MRRHDRGLLSPQAIFAMTACRDPDWPSPANRPVRAVLSRQLTGHQAPGSQPEQEAQPEPALLASLR